MHFSIGNSTTWQRFPDWKFAIGISSPRRVGVDESVPSCFRRPAPAAAERREMVLYSAGDVCLGSDLERVRLLIKIALFSSYATTTPRSKTGSPLEKGLHSNRHR